MAGVKGPEQLTRIKRAPSSHLTPICPHPALQPAPLPLPRNRRNRAPLSPQGNEQVPGWEVPPRRRNHQDKQLCCLWPAPEKGVAGGVGSPGQQRGEPRRPVPGRPAPALPRGSELPYRRGGAWPLRACRRGSLPHAPVVLGKQGPLSGPRGPPQPWAVSTDVTRNHLRGLVLASPSLSARPPRAGEQQPCDTSIFDPDPMTKSLGNRGRVTPHLKILLFLSTKRLPSYLSYLL